MPEGDKTIINRPRRHAMFITYNKRARRPKEYKCHTNVRGTQARYPSQISPEPSLSALGESGGGTITPSTI